MPHHEFPHLRGSNVLRRRTCRHLLPRRVQWQRRRNCETPVKQIRMRAASPVGRAGRGVEADAAKARKTIFGSPSATRRRLRKRSGYCGRLPQADAEVEGVRREGDVGSGRMTGRVRRRQRGIPDVFGNTARRRRNLGFALQRRVQGVISPRQALLNAGKQFSMRHDASASRSMTSERSSCLR